VGDVEEECLFGGGFAWGGLAVNFDAGHDCGPVVWPPMRPWRVAGIIRENV